MCAEGRRYISIGGATVIVVLSLMVFVLLLIWSLLFLCGSEDTGSIS